MSVITGSVVTGGTAGGLSGDGIHPSEAGHASIFDGSGGFAGTTNVKAILGI
jgi:hypothetical protein